MKLIEKILKREKEMINPKAIILTPESYAVLQEQYSEETGEDFVIEKEMTSFYGLIVGITHYNLKSDFILFEEG